MSDAPQATAADDGQEERAEEARNLAKEAVEALEDGEREEGDFLAAEAKQLDPDAAAEILGDGTP